MKWHRQKYLGKVRMSCNLYHIDNICTYILGVSVVGMGSLRACRADNYDSRQLIQSVLIWGPPVVFEISLQCFVVKYNKSYPLGQLSVTT